MTTLEAIKYREGKLEILDQLQLPFASVYLPIESVKDAWTAIFQMQVRGAPAIAITGVLSVAVELQKKAATFQDATEIQTFISDSLAYLVTSRPTAVNMADAAKKLNEFAAQQLKRLSKDATAADYNQIMIEKMVNMLEEDVAVNRAIGEHGARHILNAIQSNRQSAEADAAATIGAVLLTHCNTGSLATAGYGTALGVARRLKELGQLEHCYCTETRPYNQGSRLTAYELVYEKMPATLICDNMVGFLMSTKRVSAVVVGADRVVLNGDTANKIGTYQLAILAKHHKVPFYVAVPTTSIDVTRKTGAEIVIEHRDPREMTHMKDIRIAAEGIACLNPAFDVTPGELITGGLITEYGVVAPSELQAHLEHIRTTY